MTLAPLILLVTFLASTAGFARLPQPDPKRVARDLVRVKAVLPKGQELAGAYAFHMDEATGHMMINLKAKDDYLTAVASNYVFGDFNQDGQEDLAVAVEAPPTAASGGGQEFGPRTLLVFLGDGAGKLRPFATASKVLLKADEGGMQGDPLVSLERTGTGALRITHSGGAATNWGLVQIFQFRKDAFYLIGQTDTLNSSTEQTQQTTDTNLLTGRQVITRLKGRKGSPKATVQTVPVQPLVPLTEARAQAGGSPEE